MLTDARIAYSLKKLKVAFPKATPEFFNILSERLVANGFTDERLTDAVNHVIDNFKYKELNIADVIAFDRKVKLYTYQEISSLVIAGKVSFEDFEKREIDGRIYWIPKTDL